MGTPGDSVTLNWIVECRSQAFPAVWFIRSDCADANIKTVRSQTQVAKGQLLQVTMTFFLPLEFKKDGLVLFFDMETNEKEKFGDSLIGII